MAVACFKVISQDLTGGPEESDSRLQAGLPLGRGSNPGPPDNKEGLSITQARRTIGVTQGGRGRRTDPDKHPTL
jgi:hypothetical protein